MQLILFGPPGIGKGTQSVLLCERLGLTHVSTGDLLRAAMRAGTAVGREAKGYIEAGQLVPGAVVRRLAEDRLREIGVRDFVLDGYPRTVEQADWLTAFLEAEGTTLDAVVSLHGPEDEIVRRLSRRRLHPATGLTYHLDFNPAPAEIAEELVQRADDAPDVVRRRLQVYADETAPVEAYYHARDRHYVVDGVGAVEEVYGRILSVLHAAAPDGRPAGPRAPGPLASA